MIFITFALANQNRYTEISMTHWDIYRDTLMVQCVFSGAPARPEGYYEFRLVRACVGWLVVWVGGSVTHGSLVFLIFCIKLGVQKGSKVTKPAVSGIFSFGPKWPKRAPNWPKNELFPSKLLH